MVSKQVISDISTIITENSIKAKRLISLSILMVKKVSIRIMEFSRLMEKSRQKVFLTGKMYIKIKTRLINNLVKLLWNS